MFKHSASEGLVRLLLLSVAAAQQCYFPNGEATNATISPCNASASGHSACCHKSTSQCMSNNLCLQQNGLIGRHGCTDPTFQASECPRVCIGPTFAAGPSRLFPQSESPATFCCDNDCASSGGSFPIGGNRVDAITKFTKCPQQTAQKIGIGLGIGLPLLLAFVIVLFFLLWEKRRYAYLRKIHEKQEDKRREDEERFRALYMTERNISTKSSSSRRSTAKSSTKASSIEGFPGSETLPSDPAGSRTNLSTNPQTGTLVSKSPTELIGVARHELSAGVHRRAELPCNRQDIAEMPVSRTPIPWDTAFLEKDPTYIPSTYVLEDESPVTTLSRSNTAAKRTYHGRGLRL